MNIEEINLEILKVNNYLKKCLWMDFEFVSVDGGDIVVVGRIDILYDEFVINIDFRKFYYLFSLLYWNLNNFKLFIELVVGKEMWKVIDKY